MHTGESRSCRIGLVRGPGANFHLCRLWQLQNTAQRPGNNFPCYFGILGEKLVICSGHGRVGPFLPVQKPLGMRIFYNNNKNTTHTRLSLWVRIFLPLMRRPFLRRYERKEIKPHKEHPGHTIFSAKVFAREQQNDRFEFCSLWRFQFNGSMREKAMPV